MRNVKRYVFVKEYFRDYKELLNAIAQYDGKAAGKKAEYSLSDIIIRID